MLALLSPLLGRALPPGRVVFRIAGDVVRVDRPRPLWRSFEPFSDSQSWRLELVTGLAALGLIFYYRLWMRALSPRITEARLAACRHASGRIFSSTA